MVIGEKIYGYSASLSFTLFYSYFKNFCSYVSLVANFYIEQTIMYMVQFFPSQPSEWLHIR